MALVASSTASQRTRSLSTATSKRLTSMVLKASCQHVRMCGGFTFLHKSPDVAATSKVVLFGPTNFAPILRKAEEMIK
jgi:hypothetical protein